MMRGNGEYRPGPISVIIPVYNQAHYIARCLESVRSQDYPQKNIEIIVVDDGSVDDSIKVAEKYSVKILRQNHGGPGMARNRGVAEASSELIAFIDADDVPERNWLRTLVQYMEQNPEIAGIGCAHSLLNNHRDFFRIAWLDSQLKYTRSCQPENIDSSGLGASGSIFRKSVLDQLGGFDTSLIAAEDMDLSNRISASGKRVHLVAERLIRVEYTDRVRVYFKKQVRNVSWMVLFFLKPAKNRAAQSRNQKNSYSGYTEYIQGLMPMVFLIGAGILHNYWALCLLALFIMAYFALNLPLIKFISANKDISGLSHNWIPVLLCFFIVRSTAWNLGLIKGGILEIQKLFSSIK
jgi:glycosyltransferase involved in cell wall biosynthesis